jgi:hypothetical protein
MYKTLAELNGLDILRASFTLLFVVISFIVGFKILFKYFKLKRKELITVGLTWILIGSPWWPLAISFVTILLFNYLLDPLLYIFFMTGLSAPGLLCWMYSISELNYPHLKKKIIVIYGIICGVYEVLLLILLFTNPELVATKGVPFDGFSYNRSWFVNIFLIFVIVNAIITAILFCRASLKSENATVRWKGKFLLIGFLLFMATAVFEVFSSGNKILQAILRIFFSVASLFYYLGFFLPSWLEKALIK